LIHQATPDIPNSLSTIHRTHQIIPVQCSKAYEDIRQLLAQLEPLMDQHPGDSDPLPSGPAIADMLHTFFTSEIKKKGAPIPVIVVVILRKKRQRLKNGSLFVLHLEILIDL
jgi:hypothetical protein